MRLGAHNTTLKPLSDFEIPLTRDPSWILPDTEAKLSKANSKEKGKSESWKEKPKDIKTME